MRLPPFRLQTLIKTMIGISCVLFMTPTVLAQEKKKTHRPTQQQLDEAMEVMLREAETKKRARDALAAQLRAGRAENPLPQSIKGNTEDAFDIALFGALRTIEVLRQKLEVDLRSKIEIATTKYALTLDEQEKLRLAGAGDIKRLSDQIEEKRQQWKLVRRDVLEGERFFNQNRYWLIMYRPRPFDEGTLYAKVLQTILKEKGTTRTAAPDPHGH